MFLNWITVGEHKAALTEKDNRIAELEKQATEKAPAPDERLEKVIAAFGDAGKAADFDPVAAVTQSLEIVAQAEATTTQLNAIAKLLCHDSAEGVDLVAEIGKLKPAARTTPVPNANPADPKLADQKAYLCDFDAQLATELAQLGIKRN